ncbi:MAG: hypothetical protein BM556_03270 [Bacteriovorax sp. MedPE-SWde]|nr:MAG: hypothetical protein BM556_03270 [Bacteriovorax sp. MedPE-SWde]
MDLIKNITQSFIILTIFTSCLVKKNIPEENLDLKSSPLSIVSRGFFTVGERVYFSNGKDLYCGFKDWDMVEEYEIYYPSKFPPIAIKKEPEMMKYVPICTHALVKVDKNTKGILLRDKPKAPIKR